MTRYILFGFVLLSSACFAQTPAAFQGRVVDANTNKAVAGAFVSITRTALPPLRETTEAAADGSFAFSELPAATYQFCVQPASEGYLDPCEWSHPVPTVTLSSGQKVSGYTLKLQPGSILKIHIDDPGHLLWQNSKTGHTPHLALGVRTPQATLHAARLAAASQSGNDYEVTVPRDTQLIFSIQSFNLQIADSTGSALAGSTGAQSFTHATANQNPVSFFYKITGVLP